jgi:hypothetical protein
MADVTTTFAAKDESFAKTVGKLQGRLSEFGSSVTGFSSQVSSMASSFAKFAGPIAAVGLAFLGAKSAVQSFREAINMGGKLNDLASRTGETAGNLAILQRAMENAGGSADAVGTVLNKMQRAIIEAGEEGNALADVFRDLGISVEDFKGKSPTEQLQMIAQALSKIEDPTKRSQLAMELLGKSGGELIPLLRAMGVELETARKQLGSYPKAIDEANQALDTIGDNFGAIGKKGMEFATGLMVNLAPSLAEITTKIAEIDAAGFGMMISDYVKRLFEAMDAAYRFTDAIDMIKLAIEAMTKGEMGKGLELMWVTMKITALNAINEIIRNFMAGLQTIGDFIGKMFSPSGALVLLIQTAFTIGANYFRQAIFSAMAEVAAHFGPWGQKIAKTMLYQAETASNQIKTLTQGVGSQIEEVGHQAAEAGAAMPDTFAAKKSALNPLFDLTNEFAQQKTLQEQITAKIQEAAAPAEQIATAAQNVSFSLRDVPTTLQTAVNLSGDLFTNLNNAALGAQNVGKAFEAGKDFTEQMAFDLESTSASANQATNWLKEATYETSQMSLNGSNFAASSFAARQNISAAKVDAEITADAFTGMSDRMKQGASSVEASLDKMREAHHFGQQTSEQVYEKLRDGGMNMQEAQKAASDYMAKQSQMSADMQKAEMQKRIAEAKMDRAEQRAQDNESRGQDKAAHDIRKRAEEAYTKKMQQLAPELEKGVEMAKKMLEESGETTGDKLKDGAEEAGKVLTDAGKEVAKALKDVISPEDKDEGKNFAEEIYKFFKDTFFNDFKKRLPQNALS